MSNQQGFNFGYEEDTPRWSTPTELPDLSGSSVIALDTETFDPNLLNRGPGWDIGDGYICGVSVSVGRDRSWYFPTKHQGKGRMFDLAEIISWLQQTFTTNVTMVGANLMYDLGWLQSAGFVAHCKLFDVQFAEALLNEHRDGYSLDSLAEQYGYGGKSSDVLYKWCAHAFGGVAGERQRANIYRAPVSIVGPYAEADAFLPLLIREQQLPQIDHNELQEVVDLEHGLIPMLVAMRKRGIRVDTEARTDLSEYIGTRLHKAFVTARDVAGRVVNVNASADVAAVFDENGWEYPLLPPTPKQLVKAEITGIPTKPKPSFTKAWLMAQHDNPFALAVADLRRLDKLKGTFVDGYFDMAHEGRLHSSLHPLRTGENGTVSGRMSCVPDYVEILTDKGPTPFRELVIGDIVLTHTGCYRGVTNKWFTGYIETYRIYLSNGAALDCTADHRIMTSVGWMTLGDIGEYLHECDSLTVSVSPRADSSTHATVRRIERLGILPVFDMEVETDHTYYAGTLLVHNCSSANIQNIPARDPEFGPRIRGLFLPEEGEDWVSMDYSQIELRFLAHYALGRGAQETRKHMNADPTLDFHQMVMDKTGLGRKAAKTISFSLCYGSGVANTALLLDCTEDEARAFREKHFSGMPFMKETFDECVHVANTRGYLFTIMGRRARFPFWEASKFRLPEGLREEAEELGTFDNYDACKQAVDDLLGMDHATTGFVQRARTYKALNALLQGSAADMMKKAMLDIWQSGVCDVLGTPLNVVHDELNWSQPRTKEGREATSEARNLMAQAIKLKVPVLVSYEVGPNWGRLAEG